MTKKRDYSLVFPVYYLVFVVIFLVLYFAFANSSIFLAARSSDSANAASTQESFQIRENGIYSCPLPPCRGNFFKCWFSQLFKRGCVTPTPTPMPSPSPSPVCMPRPACLDADPACMIPEPIDGWCPAMTLPSISPLPRPTGVCSSDRCATARPTASASIRAFTPAPIVCTQEMVLCPDGSYAARDPYNNCQPRCLGTPAPTLRSCYPRATCNPKWDIPCYYPDVYDSAYTCAEPL